MQGSEKYFRLRKHRFLKSEERPVFASIDTRRIKFLREEAN